MPLATPVEEPTYGPAAFMHHLAKLEPASTVLVCGYTFTSAVRHLLHVLAESDAEFGKLVERQASGFTIQGHTLLYAAFAEGLHGETKLRALLPDMVYIDEPARCGKSFLDVVVSRLRKPSCRVIASEPNDTLTARLAGRLLAPESG